MTSSSPVPSAQCGSASQDDETPDPQHQTSPPHPLRIIGPLCRSASSGRDDDCDCLSCLSLRSFVPRNPSLPFRVLEAFGAKIGIYASTIVIAFPFIDCADKETIVAYEIRPAFDIGIPFDGEKPPVRTIVLRQDS